MSTVRCPPTAEDDARYLALQSRDARFDGHFFTGVTTTGIYCRPVCRVRTPRRDNCRFFPLATQAEMAGFRPCLRCRPELAPGSGLAPGSSGTAMPPWSTQEASGILAQQAAQWMDTPHPWSDAAPTMQSLAARLGISDRHLRRIFEDRWGVSPLQYWQTRRLLTAKQLLTDTRLPVARIAALSGFSSTRRFNASFIENYRIQPTALRRKTLGSESHGTSSGLLLHASYRPPYDVAAMLEFFAARHIPGMEVIDLERQTLARTLWAGSGRQLVHGWMHLRFLPARCQVEIRIDEALADVLPLVLAQVRALLDLDADPKTINALLDRDFPGAGGLRVPGTTDAFELAVRAILGQQVSLAAARTLCRRLVAHFGAPISTPIPGLERLFPKPQVLAGADGDVLGSMGIVRQRQRAITALAQAVSNGTLVLRPGVDLPQTLSALQLLPGIGPWTVQTIAMRALRWPDAFPSGDVALQKALGVRNAPQPQIAAETAAQRWKPWRSYAVVRAWASLQNQ